MKHLITVDDLSVEEIYEMIELANNYQTEEYRLNKKVFAANLFFEPSTRTKNSFIVAQRKLDIEPLEFHTESSSIKKGESLYDTVKTFEAIGASLLIIRHESDDWFSEIGANFNIPIINAGAGKKDHPTQCLLDVMTIHQEFGTLKNINIVIAGDIKHSRVAHSNAHTLKRLGANVYLSAAPEFIDETLDFPYISMDEAVQMADAIMLLRTQYERHKQSTKALNNYHETYGLTKERERQMKKRAIILHPGPVNRGVEIDSNLVECQRSRIFKQMTNGVYIRMAVLTKQLLKWGIINENHLEKCEATSFNKHIRSV